LFVSGSYDFIAFNYYDACKVTPLTEDKYNEEKYLLNKDSAFEMLEIKGTMDYVIIL